MEQAENISNLLRERRQREPIPSDIIINAIKKEQENMGRVISFIEEAKTKPKLVLSESQNIIGSSRNLIFKTMNGNGMEGKKLTAHGVQSFLASLVDECLQTWASEKKIGFEVKSEVRNPMTFPSSFAIYSEGMEIIQFNILEKWYGIRKEPSSEETIHASYEQEKEQLEKEFKKAKEEYEFAVKILNNPRKFAKRISDYGYIIFRKAKLRASLEKNLERKKKLVSDSENRLKRLEDGLPLRIEEDRRRAEYLQEVIPFFEDEGYEIQKNKHKLY